MYTLNQHNAPASRIRQRYWQLILDPFIGVVGVNYQEVEALGGTVIKGDDTFKSSVYIAIDHHRLISPDQIIRISVALPFWSAKSTSNLPVFSFNSNTVPVNESGLPPLSFQRNLLVSPRGSSLY